MAYLCTMCIWCPERLEERVGSLGTKVTNGSKSLCGCWVLSKGNNCSFCCCCFLGQGFSIVLGLSWKQQVLLTTDLKLQTLKSEFHIDI